MIDTHLIIGRLGSGKSSLVQQLIKNKPDNEMWVIVVNEFGQVGLDAALMTPQSNTTRTHITEISGGCICCAAQSQLRVHLNALIRQFSPQRIIIEATGLGHPAGIVDLLRDTYFRKIIRLNSVIAVVDLSLFNTVDCTSDTQSALDTDSFKQQAQLADIVVLNKQDQANQQVTDKALHYFNSIFPAKTQIILCQFGKVEQSILSFQVENKTSLFQPRKSHPALTSHSEIFLFQDKEITCFKSEDTQFRSLGYIFPAEISFNRRKFSRLVESCLQPGQQQALRFKAVINTGKFWYSFNAINQQIDSQESFYRRDNRIELIFANKSIDEELFRERLLSCIRELSDNIL